MSDEGNTMEPFKAWNGVTVSGKGARLVFTSENGEHGWLSFMGVAAVLAWDEACTAQEEQRAPTGHPVENALAFIAQTASVNEDMGDTIWRGDEVMELLDTIAQTLRGEA